MDALRGLFSLIDRRLSYMKAVAAYKWSEGLPIDDAEREDIVLRDSLSASRDMGLDVESMREFFLLQIQIAKQVQSAWHSKWKSEGFHQDSWQNPDLQAQIRPALIEIGADIVRQIREALPLLQNKNCLSRCISSISVELKTEFLEDDMKIKLLESLARIKAAQHA
ncbi:gamma subclass chorismate mutase AroQ [Candidatus Magnetominusculus xianensis]|nr:gamma subclass chorismate mutase AroQ [Candidatus Magnetominusculus xianensis]MBF0405636.1 gamma subclass chorismate mutase AroQ [Nitrospirota bacterium]